MKAVRAIARCWAVVFSLLFAASIVIALPAGAAGQRANTLPGSQPIALPAANPGAPIVVTGTVTYNGALSVTLNGTANPNGLATTAQFEVLIGQTPFRFTPPQQLGSGSEPVAIGGGGITGLPCDGFFQFRATATNSAGTTTGSYVSFSTFCFPPFAITGVADAITQTSATLHGTANTAGIPTIGYFVYGPTTNYGSTTPAQSIGAGGTIGGGAITGLACGTLYHFRVIAANGGGQSSGADATFTTLPCPAGTPTVVTGSANVTGPMSATLNGTANPNGFATNANFEYGLTTGYGNTTPVQTIGSGGSPVAIGSGAITGLTCNTTYHFRTTATNVNGTAVGADQPFTTTSCLLPSAYMELPTNFTATGATLHGTIYPFGNSTTAWFEYGLTTAYGNATPAQDVGTGTGNGPVPIGASVTGLTCDAVYHVRPVAVNANGTSRGTNATFSPPCAPTFSRTIYGVANENGNAVVFNATTLDTVATIPLPNGGGGSVAVLPDQSLAFLATQEGIWVVDLTQSPPALAQGVNPIPSPFPYIGGVSPTADGRYLIITDAFGTGKLVVIDTGTRTVDGTYDFHDFFGPVKVCDNGSVLAPSGYPAGAVRRLTITAAGVLVDTGQSLLLPPQVFPRGTACAPGGNVGVVVTSAGDLRSFLVNGMTHVSTQLLPVPVPPPTDDPGGTVAINPSGTLVFGRRYNPTAYDLDSTTGVIGAQRWSANNVWGGVLAVHPGGNHVYVFNYDFLLSLNERTGALNGGTGANALYGVALPSAVGPDVATGMATAVSATEATLTGTTNPNGSATTASFEYGSTTSYGSTTPAQDLGAGTTTVAIGGGTITGLLCNTPYHYRATATNNGGTATGSDATFTTAACAAPTVITDAATNISSSGATLNGQANPNGSATTARFEYGLTTSYGGTTPIQTLGPNPAAIGGGTITGLACNTVYHFRATATNGIGTTNGSDAMFTTAACPPTVVTGTATAIGIAGATLTGTANPNGFATTAGFQYGPTTGYGSTTSGQSLGSGTQAVAIGGGTIAGLVCNRAYHFRAVATNAGGTTYGSDAIFTTAACSKYDLNGDGMSDVVLRNIVTGQNIGWLMNGLIVTNSAFMPTIADTHWQIVGRGDFDGDGRADVLLRNNVTGQDIGWLMNGLTVSASAFTPSIVDTNWQIVGVGDMNGDGKADVMLRNKVTGQNAGWLMDGLSVSTSAFMPTVADTSWEIAGVADFDGDDKADVIVRNKSTGQSVGWLMNGLTVSLAAFLPTIADTNWEIAGVGDMDGDGKADVILRNRVTGQNVGWLMNGLTVASSAFLPTIADTDWEIKGIGDFNGDGKADVILRNNVTGQNVGWLMNGLTVRTSAFLPTIADTDWKVAGQGQ